VILLLHGFGGDVRQWKELVGQLRGATTISLDLVGFGCSDRPSVAYDLDTHWRYLIGFMDALQIRRAILVGSSMGASVALWTAARSPDRVSALTLFAPSAYPGSMRHRWPGNLVYRPGVLNWIAKQIVGGWAFRTMFPTSLGRQALDVTASYDNRFSEALQLVRQPTLLVWSRGDSRVPFSYSSQYREKLPQARFLEAPSDAGHGAASRPSREVIEAIGHLVSQVDSSSRPSQTLPVQ
jgi:pimeloyl-ACP methyl ester carboxylesterase